MSTGKMKGSFCNQAFGRARHGASEAAAAAGRTKNVAQFAAQNQLLFHPISYKHI